MERVDVEGLRIAYERAGTGPPVVLLHGGVSDSREWRRQLEVLSDEFTVVAWDAPGCGRSDDPPESFRLPDYAECLTAFVETLGLGRPHLVGLSFGGALALELHRRRPALPRTLVLASAYAGWAGSLPPDVVAERLEGALRLSGLPPERLVAELLPTLFADGAPTELRDEVGAIMFGSHPVGVRATAHAMAEADLRDVLPRIDVPTLLLYGERDVRSAGPVARELHTKIPGSKLVWLPGVGHQCNLEGAARFNEEVRSFCAR